jgi:hypothetical protein
MFRKKARPSGQDPMGRHWFSEKDHVQTRSQSVTMIQPEFIAL